MFCIKMKCVSPIHNLLEYTKKYYCNTLHGEKLFVLSLIGAAVFQT